MTDKRPDRTASALRKEQQAKEGAKAMAQYEAEIRAVRVKTEKLRALRLAKEAEDREAGLAEPGPKKASRAVKDTEGGAAIELTKARPRRTR